MRRERRTEPHLSIARRLIDCPRCISMDLPLALYSLATSISVVLGSEEGRAGQHPRPEVGG